MADGKQSIGGFLKVALTQFFAKIQLFGADSNGIQNAVRVNDERDQIQVEPVENWIEVDPVVLGTSANTVVWNPGSTATDVYLVEFELVNSYSVAGGAWPLVYVGLDIGATGSLTHYVWRKHVPWRHTTGWRGPYVMNGDDDFMAWSGDASSITINFRIRKVFR